MSPECYKQLMNYYSLSLKLVIYCVLTKLHFNKKIFLRKGTTNLQCLYLELFVHPLGSLII